MKDYIIAAVLMLFSAAFDSQGFIHGSLVWRGKNINFSEIFLSFANFSIGIAIYWISIKFLTQKGIVSPEVQTAIWMVATLIGIGIISQKFFSWSLLDKSIALFVLVGIGILAKRVG